MLGFFLRLLFSFLLNEQTLSTYFLCVPVEHIPAGDYECEHENQQSKRDIGARAVRRFGGYDPRGIFFIVSCDFSQPLLSALPAVFRLLFAGFVDAAQQLGTVAAHG